MKNQSSDEDEPRLTTSRWFNGGFRLPTLLALEVDACGSFGKTFFGLTGTFLLASKKNSDIFTNVP